MEWVPPLLLLLYAYEEKGFVAFDASANPMGEYRNDDVFC